MIPNFLISGNKNKGSSLMLPANGLGGSRATILFLFSFLKAAAAPALRALKQAGKKEGGWGEGIFARLCFPRRRRGWGGNAGRNSIRKILWILLKKSSDFNQKAPPIYRIRILGPAKRDCPCLAACLPCLPAGRRQRAAGGVERQSSQSGAPKESPRATLRGKIFVKKSSP